jgi:hypothetical protein
LEFYAELGDMEPQDADSKIEGFYAAARGGLAELTSGLGYEMPVQLTEDADLLNHDLTTLFGVTTMAHWDAAGKTAATDAYHLQRDIAELYLATDAQSTTIMSEQGTGDTRPPSSETPVYPYTPEELLLGSTVASVPATGMYAFTWSIGSECAKRGWGFEVVLPFFGVSSMDYLATSSNIPPDALRGSRTIYLLAGTLALKTIVENDPALNGQPVAACPWQYTIVGPAAN